MRDVPIYAKTLKEYYSKNPREKSRDPLTIDVMGKFIHVKYGVQGNPILMVQNNEIEIPNVVVDLGASINVITFKTMHTLGLQNLKQTPTVLEIKDRSIVNPVGKMEDITLSDNSWHYLVDILVLQTKFSPAGGHPLILGRPWLATIDSYIGCQSRNMVIPNGKVTNNLIFYPPVEPIPSRKPYFRQKPLPIEGSKTKNEELRLVLTIGQALQYKT